MRTTVDGDCRQRTVTLPFTEVLGDVKECFQQLLVSQQQLLRAISPNVTRLAPNTVVMEQSDEPVLRPDSASRIEAPDTNAAVTATNASVNRSAAASSSSAPDVHEVRQHTSKRGAAGCSGGDPSIQDISDAERHLLRFRQPQAAAYFNEAQHVFYYPQGAVGVRTPQCSSSSSSSIPHALRDQCADANPVTQKLAERKWWRIIPTSTSLSTGTTPTCLVYWLVTVR